MTEKQQHEIPSPTILFVKNLQHNTLSIEAFLVRHGFTVVTEMKLTAALEKINTIQPQYIFVALDHVDTGVGDFIGNLPTKALVIPFITSTQSSDMKKLIAHTSPVKMFPPLSGPGIQRLISKHEKNKIEIPSKIFVAQGQRFNDLTQKIQPLTKDDLDFNSFFDSVTDLTLDIPAAHFSKNIKVKLTAGQKQSLAYKFDNKIQKELTDAIQFSKDQTPSDFGSTAFCMLVRSIDSSGLILLHSEWNLTLDDVESSLLMWADDLTKKYDNAALGSSVYYSHVFPVTLSTSTKPLDTFTDKTALQKNLIIDDKSTVMSFFDLQYNPFDLAAAYDPNYFIVDHNCLHKTAKINFDLFFRLVENKKLIKLFKTGSSLSDLEIKSVLDKKDFPLMIDVADELNWYQYGVESFLDQ